MQKLIYAGIFPPPPPPEKFIHPAQSGLFSEEVLTELELLLLSTLLLLLLLLLPERLPKSHAFAARSPARSPARPPAAVVVIVVALVVVVVGANTFWAAAELVRDKGH